MNCPAALTVDGLAAVGPSAAAVPADNTQLAGLPVSIFATVMGLAGLTMACARAHQLGVLPVDPSAALRWASTALYVFLLGVYATKWWRHPAAVAAEVAHPMRLTFFSTVTIGPVLLGTAWADLAPEIARWVWGGGAVLHLGFTLIIISSWIYHPHYEIRHVSPAWFVPVVGNVVVPVAGVKFLPAEVSWLFFSIGLVFWVVLKTIVIYRLVFHEPLQTRFVPTLFILIAPPAVAFIAYLALTGSLDPVARVLYYISLFLTALLLANVHRFVRVPLSLSAWAYSFPLAAITLASFEMGARTDYVAFVWIGSTLFGLLGIVVSALVIWTTWAAVTGRLGTRD